MSIRPATLAFPAALVLALAASSCRLGSGLVAHEYAPPLVPAPTLGTMRNVSRCDCVWTGSRPSAADLDLADRRGIARAIDVCSAQEGRGSDLAALCEELGMEYVRVDSGSAAAIPDDEEVDLVLDELRRGDREPTLLFSGSGDRAAMLVAVWRSTDRGIAVEESIEEARRAGMKPGAPVEFVRSQVARLSSAPADWYAFTLLPTWGD